MTRLTLPKSYHIMPRTLGEKNAITQAYRTAVANGAIEKGGSAGAAEEIRTRPDLRSR